MSSPLEVARIGNPWLTGKSVERIVPLYVLHAFLAPSFKTASKLSLLKDAVVDASLALKGGLSTVVKVPDTDLELFGDVIAGLLAADRRIFNDRKAGGASKEGSLFPVVGGLVKRASDDGLGSSMRHLFELHGGEWKSHLHSMLSPVSVSDPATQCVKNLLGDEWAQSNEEAPPPSGTLSPSDSELVSFISNLIRTTMDASRIAAVRELALGVYLAAIVRMVSGPINEVGAEGPLVFVFAGLPPGDQRDPRVLAASQSYKAWLSSSWRGTHQLLAQRLAEEPSEPNVSIEESRRQRLLHLVAKRVLDKAPAAVTPLEPALGDLPTDEKEWCRAVLEGPAIALTRSELMRRVRSLGSNIGLAGPDRGIGSPRLFFDTPLLNVLVRGIVGDGRMDFESFVSELAQTFGFVVGPGADSDVLDGLKLTGAQGSDPYEIAVSNQELLRERLIRVGLARAYSDSHTEVVVND